LGVFGQLLTTLRDVYDIPTGKAQFLKRNLFTEFRLQSHPGHGQGKVQIQRKKLFFVSRQNGFNFVAPMDAVISRDLLHKEQICANCQPHVSKAEFPQKALKFAVQKITKITVNYAPRQKFAELLIVSQKKQSAIRVFGWSERSE
jgi:hypothetical protein